ncbi:MAG: hypothetical protein AB1453_15650 [Chloroflexota bacterium]|jgi:hypothetical protein
MNPLVFSIIALERQEQLRQEKFINQYFAPDSLAQRAVNPWRMWMQRLVALVVHPKPDCRMETAHRWGEKCS